MLIIESAYPRSANTFLCNILTKSLPDAKYVKIPRDFSSYKEFRDFSVSNMKIGEFFVLGHNHMHRLWEFFVCIGYKIPTVMTVRNPVDRIASLIVMQESKPYNRGSDYFNTKKVFQEVRIYSRFTVFIIIMKLLARPIVVLDFSAVISDPNNCIEYIGKKFSVPVSFKSEYAETFKSKNPYDNKIRQKDSDGGYRSYMTSFQKGLINTICFPQFLILRLLSYRL